MVYLILFIIAMVLFYGYWGWVVWLVGLKNLPSWSHSYNELEKKKDWYKYIFQGVMVIMSFLYSIVIFELTGNLWFQFFGAFTTIPIAFVGFAPRLGKENLLENGVHVNAAKISALSSLILVVGLSIYVDKSIALTIPAASMLAYLSYRITANDAKVLWAEMACFWWMQSTMAFMLNNYLKNL